MHSFWFQHQREIDAFTFRDIETISCKESPACGWIREKFPRYGRWQNNKTRIGCAHELSSASLVKRREVTFDSGAKIPDQTRLLKFDCSKLHIRLQIRAGHLKELICREKSRQHRRNCKSNRNPHTRSCYRHRCKQRAAAFNRRSFMPVSRKQKGKQRKRR